MALSKCNNIVLLFLYFKKLTTSSEHSGLVWKEKSRIQKFKETHIIFIDCP